MHGTGHGKRPGFAAAAGEDASRRAVHGRVEVVVDGQDLDHPRDLEDLADLGLGPVKMAGKTGTAQHYSYGSGRGVHGTAGAWALRDHAWFVAYAPYDDPKYAIAVLVEHGGFDDLPAFHAVYVETAERDRFTPRGLAYFQRMWTELNGIDPDRLRLYVARHDGHVAAARGAGFAGPSGSIDPCRRNAAALAVVLPALRARLSAARCVPGCCCSRWTTVPSSTR